ncbi:SAF domain-containing protein [Actinokineospora terrae]|uniref:Flp pilus assembly protein CpaB n=1 Tax=Actinokineospora terrae TaxID=155974 RepID=A0A1H9UKH5_9PSEU|nr:SAF domain-containing protein [Actinokineospora terrae]SES10050.1 Flp pilus assembly protein CpaB [Actinokineospora terrae]
MIRLRRPRQSTVRRVLAAALVLVAGCLAVRPSAPDASVPVLVAARALAPGVALTPGDVKVMRAPPDLRPAAALSDPAEAVARVPAGAIGEGEPITRVRLVGADNLAATAGPDGAAVPVRLPDDGVADLLYPGVRVDVIARERVVLARDAAVLTVRPSDAGVLVLLALPRAEAAEVAAAALREPVAVTLR